jgi:hypothetical protein
MQNTIRLAARRQLAHGTRAKTVLTEIGPVQIEVPATGTPPLTQ